jgi:hypothetical protein
MPHAGIPPCSRCVPFSTLSINRRFGIAHVVIISATEASCLKIIAAFSGPVCCVWEDVQVPSNHIANEGFRGQWNHRMLWFIRYGDNGNNWMCLCRCPHIHERKVKGMPVTRLSTHFQYGQPLRPHLSGELSRASQDEDSCPDTQTGIQFDVP